MVICKAYFMYVMRFKICCCVKHHIRDNYIDISAYLMKVIPHIRENNINISAFLMKVIRGTRHAN